MDEVFNSPTLGGQPNPSTPGPTPPSTTGESSNMTSLGSQQVGAGNSKRTVDERSPETVQQVRSVRPRMNEFDIGEAFAVIEDNMKKGMEQALSMTPEALQGCMKAAMDTMVQTMRGVMNKVSDGIQQERLTREAEELRSEVRLERAEAKVADLQATVDSLTELRVKNRTRDSIREMEGKVEVSLAALKLTEVDIGRVTQDRKEIVRKTLDEVRHYVVESDLRYYDRVIRRTRVVILGKSTERWERDGEEFFSVPTLFQCRDTRDQEELNGILRAAGYFPSFHWPKEMMEFVGCVREDLKGQGFRPESHFIKIRPEKREGKVLIKAEVKQKSSTGRFILKGLWKCPPIDRYLWDDIPNILAPITSYRATSG